MCQLPHFAGFISSIAFVPRPRPSSSWPSSPCCAAAASGPCAASRNFSGAAWRRRCMAGCTMSSCERRDAMDDGEINNQLGVNFLCSFQLVYAANQASIWRTIPGFSNSRLGKKHIMLKMPWTRWDCGLEKMEFMATLQVRLRLAEVPGGVFLHASTILFELRDCAVDLWERPLMLGAAGPDSLDKGTRYLVGEFWGHNLQNAEPLVNSYVLFWWGGWINGKTRSVHNLVEVTHAHPTVEPNQGFLQHCRPSARNCSRLAKFSGKVLQLIGGLWKWILGSLVI